MISLKSALTRFAPLLLFVLLINGCSEENSSSVALSDGEEQLFTVSGGDFAGAHILVSYSGSASADSNTTRTKEEAFDRAKELIAQVQAAPETFADVARQESDGPSSVVGGDLGVWPKGTHGP